MIHDSLKHLDEPLLQFGFQQKLDDPREGLFAFGPLQDARKPASMRVGVVGTIEGIARYKEWVARVQGYIPPLKQDVAHHVAFPGFEAVFKAPWPTTPVVELAVSAQDVSRALRISDRHQAIYQTVSLFEEPIRSRLRDDDAVVDLWFVVVPEEVYLLGRPLSRVRRSEQIKIEQRMNLKLARRLMREPSLFPDDNAASHVYSYDVNFHHQLKLRLLDQRAVVQVLRETSIALPEKDDAFRSRRLQDPATLAWNLCTASYFKAGGRPWRLANVRKGVCYVGLVFKMADDGIASGNACCGAQMFLDSGDGLVFKGAVGPWWSSETKEFHLAAPKAHELISMVVEAYMKIHGEAPAELFIHGKTRFNEEEWKGFSSAVPGGTKIVCVRIVRSQDLKLFRDGDRPVLRGTYYKVNSRRLLLWTSGYVARLQTYAGREVPNPLSIEIVHGDTDLDEVAADILALTKVNFNACIYGDGLPVTLRFADAVGEILTAGASVNLPPLPFRHYI